MMSLITAVFLLCAGSSVRALWRDPLTGARLEIINYSTTLEAGDTPNITCTSVNFPLGSETLYFTQQLLGSTEEHHLYLRGLSPLQFENKLEITDHGTTIMCQSGFSERNPEEHEDTWTVYKYEVKSPQVPIILVGGSVTKSPLVTSGEVRISTDVDTNNLSVGDKVKLTCEVVGMFGNLGFFQSKGIYAVQLDYSWQWYRVITFTVDENDNGSQVYCQISTNDYFYYSSKITLTVN